MNRDWDCQSEFGNSRRENDRNRCNIGAVVTSITKDYWILACEHPDPDKEKVYRMDRESFNISHKAVFPRIREFVTIRECVVESAGGQPWIPTSYVKRFEYIPDETRGYIKDEVMAVAQIKPNYITLVGKSFTTSVHACINFDTEEFAVGQLVIGCLTQLPMFVDVFRPKFEYEADDVVHYKLNYKVQKYANRREIECPDPLLYPELIRPLTPQEEELVFNRCITLENIDLFQAQRWIQEPHIAAGLLEKFTQYQEIFKYFVSVPPESIGVDQNGIPFLTFTINIYQYKHLFQTQSLVTWRVGGDLQVVHKRLILEGREKEGHMVIKKATARNNGYLIQLQATNRSLDLLKVAFSHERDFRRKGEMFHISPLFDNRDATVEALRCSFDEFFLQRRHMFDLCTGRVEKPEEVEIKDREKPFLVNGKPLDASQLDFMRSAAAIPGFTCAQAPPGCGKTHTTSALVSHLKHMKVKGGICISGTTNAAVTNAADAVATRFPDIRITREYSLKAEADITAVSQKASLKHMASDAGKYVNLDEHSELKEGLQQMRTAQEQLNQRAPNLYQHLSRVQNVLKSERNVKRGFIQAYNLHVYATTVELLIRKGDIFRGGNEEEDKSVRRLILDEAAQMSPVEALALYCSFPHLEYITLLGDMKQLGPHSCVPPGSACFRLISEGELTRMFKLTSTTKRELNTIYRCHPAITEKFLIPIYGPQMKSGVSAASRNLAEKHGLMVADDGSPCLLIDVDGCEEKGRNDLELKTALDLIYDIVDIQKVAPEDVVVICNHRAQMNCLNQELKDQGVFGPLKTKVVVHTVDSFQGKEAKVVILLTTKTCHPSDTGEIKMQFVGNAARGTVAVSRAQHALYILGHWVSLAKTQFWAQFLKNMIHAGGIRSRLFGETPVVKYLREQIQFSYLENVEEVRVEVIEPQLDPDYEYSDSEYSDEEANIQPQPDNDVVLIDFGDLSISSPDTPSTSSRSQLPPQPKPPVSPRSRPPPEPVEVPTGDLISI